MSIITPEHKIENSLVAKLQDLKYEHRRDIHDRATLEANFKEKFEALNRVKLTDGEFQRLLDNTGGNSRQIDISGALTLRPH